MNLHGLKVIDFHSHFPIQREGRSYNRLQRLIDRYGEKRARKLMDNSLTYRDAWRKMWQFDNPERNVVHSDEEQAARWIADMDAKSLDRVNFVMGGGNDNLAKIVSWHPDRFTGFAQHNIFEEGAGEELERAVNDLDLKGFKLIASGQRKPIDSKEAYPVWEMAENLEVPVLIHFGVLGMESSSRFSNLRFRYPTLRGMLLERTIAALLAMSQRLNRHQRKQPVDEVDAI